MVVVQVRNVIIYFVYDHFLQTGAKLILQNVQQL